MDPIQRLWLFQNWLADQKEKAELAKNQAYLIGSFSNPEAVKSMFDGETHISSEEEFEESSRMVLESRNLSQLLQEASSQNQEVKKRKRRSLKE